MWSRAVCNCFPLDYCHIFPKQSMEGTARYRDLSKMDAASGWLWQFLSPEGPVIAQPGERQPSAHQLGKALLLQHYHHQNQQTKNTFRRKCASLVRTSRVAENWMEELYLQHRDTFLANTDMKILHQIPWALKEWRCAKTLGGNYIFIYLFIIFFISVFIWVLRSMIGYSGCIPLLIMKMSESYVTMFFFLPPPILFLLP